jgi:hypothetical protein
MQALARDPNEKEIHIGPYEISIFADDSSDGYYVSLARKYGCDEHCCVWSTEAVMSLELAQVTHAGLVAKLIALMATVCPDYDRVQDQLIDIDMALVGLPNE